MYVSVLYNFQLTSKDAAHYRGAQTSNLQDRPYYLKNHNKIHNTSLAAADVVSVEGVLPEQRLQDQALTSYLGACKESAVCITEPGDEWEGLLEGFLRALDQAVLCKTYSRWRHSHCLLCHLCSKRRVCILNCVS